MSKVSVRNIKGEEVGVFDLPDGLLVRDRGTQVVHDAVVAQLANRRAGSASTLTKGEVAGSNKKPWKQKGTGRARAGYRQSPVWRGGGVAHGPKPRSFDKKLSKKAKRLAFSRALSEQVEAGQLVVLEDLTLEQPKTSRMAAVVKSLSAGKGMLLIVDRVDRNVALASRNISKLEVATSQDVNTYQVLRYPLVAVTRKAMAELESRLKASARRKS